MVKEISSIYKSFVSDIQAAAPWGDIRVSSDNIDSAGADFAFDLYVPKNKFQEAIQKTSELEAQYFIEHHINFLILPHS